MEATSANYATSHSRMLKTIFAAKDVLYADNHHPAPLSSGSIALIATEISKANPATINIAKRKRTTMAISPPFANE